MTELNFTHSYHHANSIVRSVKKLDPIDLFAGISETSPEFFNRICKPRKDSLLHDVIRCEASNIYDKMTQKLWDGCIEELTVTFKESGMQIPDWFNEEEIGDHIRELDEMLIPAAEQEVCATFHLLFANRNFLFDFQAAISDYFIKKLKQVEYPEIMKRDGVLKRAKFIPEWLKVAVFHRDQGRCQLCWKDITGLLVPVRDYQLDHMIPLAASGSNDATNFQLVCSECNARKGRNVIVKPHKVGSYW